jgi:hypothetical protein
VPDKKASVSQQRTKSHDDRSMSESVTEDVHTALDDASSLKLDLGASSDQLHSMATPRAMDSARTLADISEECPASARITARDESSVTAGTRQPGSGAAKVANSPRQASIISAGASYTEDFSSVASSHVPSSHVESSHVPSSHVASHQDKRPSSVQPAVSQQSARLSEESVATEEDVTEAALSDDDAAPESIDVAVPLQQDEVKLVSKGSDHSPADNG